MTKEDFVLSIKRAGAAFLQDGPDIGNATSQEWAAAYNGWLASLAKLEVDTKRTAKARKNAADLRTRAEAAGLALVSKEEVIEQYDTALANAEARAARAEAKLKE